MSWHPEGCGLFGFWPCFGSVTGLLLTCPVAEALPKAKDFRGSSPPLFCRCPGGEIVVGSRGRIFLPDGRAGARRGFRRVDQKSHYIYQKVHWKAVNSW
jgi:hypothetical protein